MNKRTFLICLLFCCTLSLAYAQQVAILKYGGGGDWYSNPTALPNLIAFCNTHINTKIDPEPETVEVASVSIFKYPYLHMTGHGNVFFNDEEVQNLRTYLLSGGFLHIDDNYGMEPYLRRELEKVFPERPLEELVRITPSSIKSSSFPKDCPKSMNTMASDHRPLAFLKKEGSYCSIPMSVI